MSCRKEEYANLEKYKKTKKEQSARYYGKTSKKYTSRDWTVKEEKMVLEHSITDTELSKIIHRSVGAIQTKRYELKKA